MDPIDTRTEEEEGQSMFQIDSRGGSWGQEEEDRDDDDDDSSSSGGGDDGASADRFHDEDDSWQTLTPKDELDAEFGFQSPTSADDITKKTTTTTRTTPTNNNRRLESMSIMMGSGGWDDNDNLSSNARTCCSRYWYLWLCGSVVAVTMLLVWDGMREYQKNLDMLVGTANGLDDFDIAQCKVYNGETLEMVNKYFAMVDNATVFCQNDKMEHCNCKHPFEATEPEAHNAQWKAAAGLNQALVAQNLKHRPDVVLLGDSIVEHLAGRNLGYTTRDWKPLKDVFDRLFSKAEGGKVNGIPLGIGGDRIQNLLYRLQNGEAPIEFHPKVWWVLIGTNDLEDFCGADAITIGNFRIVDEIRRFHPGAKIVLNSILPRNDGPDLESSPTWKTIAEINLKMECYANTAFGVEFFNATDVFTYKRNGKTIVNPKFMKDPVHPNAEGSRLWSEAIVDRVVELKDKLHHHGGKSKKKNHHSG